MYDELKLIVLKRSCFEAVSFCKEASDRYYIGPAQSQRPFSPGHSSPISASSKTWV